MLFFVWCSWMEPFFKFLRPPQPARPPDQLFSKKKVIRKSFFNINHMAKLAETICFFIHTFKRYKKQQMKTVFFLTNTILEKKIHFFNSFLIFFIIFYSYFFFFRNRLIATLILDDRIVSTDPYPIMMATLLLRPNCCDRRSVF